MLSCAMAPNEVEPDGERWSGCFGDWGLRDRRASCHSRIQWAVNAYCMYVDSHALQHSGLCDGRDTVKAL